MQKGCISRLRNVLFLQLNEGNVVEVVKETIKSGRSASLDRNAGLGQSGQSVVLDAGMNLSFRTGADIERREGQ